MLVDKPNKHDNERTLCFKNRQKITKRKTKHSNICVWLGIQSCWWWNIERRAKKAWTASISAEGATRSDLTFGSIYYMVVFATKKKQNKTKLNGMQRTIFRGTGLCIPVWQGPLRYSYTVFLSTSILITLYCIALPNIISERKHYHENAEHSQHHTRPWFYEVTSHQSGVEDQNTLLPNCIFTNSLFSGSQFPYRKR